MPSAYCSPRKMSSSSLSRCASVEARGSTAAMRIAMIVSPTIRATSVYPCEVRREREEKKEKIFLESEYSGRFGAARAHESIPLLSAPLPFKEISRPLPPVPIALPGVVRRVVDRRDLLGAALDVDDARLLVRRGGVRRVRLLHDDLPRVRRLRERVDRDLAEVFLGHERLQRVGVVALVRVELVEAGPEREEVLAQRRLLGPDGSLLELRHGDRDQDPEDGHHDEQLDEREALSVSHAHQSLYFVLSRAVSGESEYTS